MISYSGQSFFPAYTFYFNPTSKPGYKLRAKFKALRKFFDLLRKIGQANLRLAGQIYNEINPFTGFDLGHDIYTFSKMWIGQGKYTISGNGRFVQETQNTPVQFFA